MSRDYQEEFLNEQIEEYNELLLDSASKGAAQAHRNIIKTIEKQKAAREAKLKDLLADEKKDDGLVFDELGVDHRERAKASRADFYRRKIEAESGEFDDHDAAYVRRHLFGDNSPEVMR
jgi:hypothetical protein